MDLGKMVDKQHTVGERDDDLVEYKYINIKKKCASFCPLILMPNQRIKYSINVSI